MFVRLCTEGHWIRAKLISETQGAWLEPQDLVPAVGPFAGLQPGLKWENGCPLNVCECDPLRSRVSAEVTTW